MADLTLVGTQPGQDTSLTSTTISAAVPSGTANGNGQRIWYSSAVLTGGGAPTHTTPAGWTAAGTTTYTNLGGLDGRVTCYVKIAGSSESAVTLTSSANAAHQYHYSTYSNPDAAAFLNASAVFTTVASGTSHVIPSILTTAARVLLDQVLFATSAGISWTPPGGTTERYDDGSTALGDEIQLVAGDSGTRTWTSSASTASVIGQVALAGNVVTITAQPTDQTVNNGATAPFSVTVSGGVAPLTYQWRKNGSNISGANSSSYTTPAVSYSDQAATFDCIVTDATSQATTSSAATLRVASNLTGTGPRVYPGFGYPWGVGAYGTFTRGSVTAGGPITIGQASESDTAQPMVSRQSKAVGIVTETDSAQPVTIRQARTLGQPTETDTAQAFAQAQARSVGQPSEVDTAQPLTDRQQLAVGLVTESDSAQPVAIGGAGLTLGQALETDTAQPATSAQRKAVGQVVEADLAQALTVVQQRTLGQAVETDAALAATAMRRLAIGQPAETDTAQTVARLQRATLGQPVETDSAQQFSGGGATILNPASETDAALALSGQQAKAIGIPLEADFAQAVAAAQRRTLGQVSEVDSASPMGAIVARQIGQPSESDAALAVLRRLQWQIGQAAEVDEAFTFSAPGYEDDPSIFYRYEVPAGSLRFDVPALSLRFEVPGQGLRFDVPSIGRSITLN